MNIDMIVLAICIAIMAIAFVLAYAFSCWQERNKREDIL